MHSWADESGALHGGPDGGHAGELGAEQLEAVGAGGPQFGDAAVVVLVVGVPAVVGVVVVVARCVVGVGVGDGGAQLRGDCAWLH